MASSTSNDPLLGGVSNHKPSAAPFSRTTLAAIRLLSFLRIVSGIPCILAPCYTGALLAYPIAAEYAFLVRLHGVKNVVFGELLRTAQGRQEITRNLWACVAVDVLDVASITYGVFMGQLGRSAGGVLGVVALGTLGLGMIALRGL